MCVINRNRWKWMENCGAWMESKRNGWFRTELKLRVRVKKRELGIVNECILLDIYFKSKYTQQQKKCSKSDEKIYLKKETLFRYVLNNERIETVNDD